MTRISVGWCFDPQHASLAYSHELGQVFFQNGARKRGWRFVGNVWARQVDFDEERVTQSLRALRNETVAFRDFIGCAGDGDYKGLLGACTCRDNALNVCQVFRKLDGTVTERVETGVCIWRVLMLEGVGSCVVEAVLIDGVVVRIPFKHAGSDCHSTGVRRVVQLLEVALGSGPWVRRVEQTRLEGQRHGCSVWSAKAGLQYPSSEGRVGRLPSERALNHCVAGRKEGRAVGETKEEEAARSARISSGRTEMRCRNTSRHDGRQIDRWRRGKVREERERERVR